jgi:hypothetical protein
MNEEQFYNHIENNSHASTNIIAYSSILALPPELSQEEQIKLSKNSVKISQNNTELVLVMRYMKQII